MRPPETGCIDAFSLPLAKTHKHIKITIHDLPEALVQSQVVWERDCPEAVQENRVEFLQLDFFTQVPIKDKDIYYLRNIIHDWPDHESAVILQAPEPLLPNFGVGNMRKYQQDLMMWIMHNAKERTLQNSLELSTTAGLKLDKVWDLTESCVLEFSAA
ncbi:hypothetical protein HD554DRAFT_2310590 [Boletus coccyginus]|nr:hypothetical protein HD554DRAFT_2310590 [Boletus coccyginus]